MQLINVLSETDKECDGQNITMYNSTADRQTQPILSTSSTPRGQHQTHKSCSNVGGSNSSSPPHNHDKTVYSSPPHDHDNTVYSSPPHNHDNTVYSSPPHDHDNTVYSFTQAPINRHLTGNNLNRNPSGGVTPLKDVMNSPEHRLVPVRVNTNKAVHHHRPLSAPAVVLNAPATSFPFLDSPGSVRNAGRGGSKILSSSKMRNENITTENLQQPQDCKNISGIYFTNLVELEIDCLRPERSIESQYDTLPSERDNKTLIDTYDENMNLSDTVNNNVLISDVQTGTLTTNEEILSPEISSRTPHISKYGVTPSHNVIFHNAFSSDINIHLQTVGDVNYDSTPESGSLINPDEEKLSCYDNPPIWTSLALRDNHRYDASIIVPLPQHNMIKRVNVKCNHLFVPIHRPGRSESFHSTTLAACPCSQLINRDTPNLEDTEVRVYFERRRFEIDRSPLIGNRFQTEQGTLNSNRFQTEQGTLSSNSFQTEQGSLSSNSFEFLHLGNNASQTEKFQLDCSDLTCSMDAPREPVLTCDGDIIVGARIEFSPTLVNLQTFIRLLPTLHKCRDQLSDDLTSLYQDDDDDDWLSDEDELDFHETDGEFGSTLRPTNPVANVLCNGGSEHFLPVKQTNVDDVSCG